jgi:hypothetical protein
MEKTMDFKAKKMIFKKGFLGACFLRYGFFGNQFLS